MQLEDVKAQFVGRSAEPEPMEVERGSAQRYAVAVGDLNPLYLDDALARAAGFDAIVAPPGFFGWPVRQPSPSFSILVDDLRVALADAGFPNTLDGGGEFDFRIPIQAGQQLLCTRTLTDMRERNGSDGRRMVLCSLQTDFHDLSGALVTRLNQTVIFLTPAP